MSLWLLGNRVNPSVMTLFVDHSIKLDILLFKPNIIDKTIIFVRIQKLFTNVLQGIHNRNIIRNIHGTTCWRDMHQGVVMHFE